MTDLFDEQAYALLTAFYGKPEPKNLQDDIAAALRTERERCAKIADEVADDPARPEQPINWASGKRYGAQKIAAAIRAPIPEESRSC